MHRSIKPKLVPSESYSYLRFVGPTCMTFTEVFLPDDSSFIVELGELRKFLKECGVEHWDKLVDFIYNFGNVLWNRQDQRYYPVNRKEILPKDTEHVDELEEIPYGFN